MAVTAAGGHWSPTAVSDDLGPGALVGRYVVLSRLGAGGMGVVFAAYDPELDRKVAIKLLHPHLAAHADPSATRDASARLVREAQALARLSHPNIVAIHDVGERQGAVWLAMEYIDGETLSAWLDRRRHGWRDVLEILIPAARGLAAAHEAGLVHRDIKPDNLMIGADGRVRVMDLGLARALGRSDEPAEGAGAGAAEIAAPLTGSLGAHVTRAGTVMGTPAYMSPEQFRGEVVDARADVFSFCVTLWEALMGERPFAGDTLSSLEVSVLAGALRPAPRAPRAGRVPGWLRRVCLRGLVVDPAGRIPSMKDLLDALARGRTRARAGTWLWGLGVAAAVGAAALGADRHEHAARVAACERAGAGVVEVWNDGGRSRVREGLLATRLPIAAVTADKVIPLLDAQAEAWREQRTRVCLRADVERTLDPERLARAVWCLDDRRMELASLVAELAGADALSVQRAVTAAVDLAPVSTCTNDQVLTALPSPPPADAREAADAIRVTLSQAQIRLAAGKYGEGIGLARAALADAESLQWPPLVAAARELEGNLLDWTGAYADAEAACRSAFMTAAKVQAWEVAARAALQLIFIVGIDEARPAEGKVWAELAEVTILLAGDPLGLREADRLQSLAGIHHTTGAYAEATDLYRRALAIHEAELGPRHLDVANTLNNLGLVFSITGAHAEARRTHERALAIYEEALGPAHPTVAASLNNLANVHQDTGDNAAARALHARALAIREEALGPDHPDVAHSLNNLANVYAALGERGQARALLERALAIRERSVGLEHPLGASALAALGAALLGADEPAAALPLLEQAVAVYDRFEGVQEGELYARWSLANGLLRVGRDRQRALAEAEKAADGYRGAGEGMARSLAEVEAFLAAHRDPP